MNAYRLPLDERTFDLEQAAARAAARRRNPGDARTIRAVAKRWSAWAQAHDVVAFPARSSDLNRFVTESAPAARHKVRWALRAICTAADIAAEEHGLGIGDQSDRLQQIKDPRLHQVIHRVLAERRRQRVWRSGLTRLLAWAEQFDIHPLDVTAPDLDDYREWITRVGGDKDELMVIARQFVRVRWQLLLESRLPANRP